MVGVAGGGEEPRLALCLLPAASAADLGGLPAAGECQWPRAGPGWEVCRAAPRGSAQEVGAAGAQGPRGPGCSGSTQLRRDEAQSAFLRRSPHAPGPQV